MKYVCRLPRVAPLFAWAFLLAPCAVQADFVVPRPYATTEGVFSQTSFGLIGNGNLTLQVRISASELSIQGVLPGFLITGVAGRLDAAASTGPAADIVVSDMEITFAKAAVPGQALAPGYTVNMIDPIMVRDGPYTLPANSMPGGGSPNAFGAVIPFSTPYAYQGGDLIFMLSRTAANTNFLAFDYATRMHPAYSLLFDNTFHSTGGGASELSVMKFSVTAVPEARAFWLIGLVAAGAGTSRVTRRWFY